MKEPRTATSFCTRTWKPKGAAQFSLFKLVDQSSPGSSLEVARFGPVLHSSELIYLQMG